jgi:hypothetical protein
MGRSVMRLPVALNTALAMAAGTPTMTSSAESLDAQGPGDCVLAGQEAGFEGGDVCVDWHEVIGDVRVDHVSVAVIEVCVFQ